MIQRTRERGDSTSFWLNSRWEAEPEHRASDLSLSPRLVSKVFRCLNDVACPTARTIERECRRPTIPRSNCVRPILPRSFLSQRSSEDRQLRRPRMRRGMPSRARSRGKRSSSGLPAAWNDLSRGPLKAKVWPGSSLSPDPEGPRPVPLGPGRHRKRASKGLVTTSLGARRVETSSSAVRELPMTLLGHVRLQPPVR